MGNYVDYDKDDDNDNNNFGNNYHKTTSATKKCRGMKGSISQCNGK